MKIKNDKLIGGLIIIGMVVVVLTACSKSSFSIDQVKYVLEKDGIEAAVKYYETARSSSQANANISIEQLDNLGNEYYQMKQPEVALRLLELNKKYYPDSARVYLSLAQLKHSEGKRAEVENDLLKAYQIDSLWLKVILLKKRYYFVPEDFEVPEKLETADFVVRPIKEADAEMDYKAVMGSVEHLTGVLGRRDWPGDDLTLEEDQRTLLRHEKEFDRREGFVYTVLSPDERECIGCVYIYPARVDLYDCEIVLWVTEDAFEQGLDQKLYESINSWIKESWKFERPVYPGREIGWGEYVDLLDQQDKKYHW